MMKIISKILSILLFFYSLHSIAQQPLKKDFADDALISAFSRDYGNTLCPPKTKNSSIKEIKEVFEPYIKDIDRSNELSYPSLAVAVYTAFPCPFSPYRPELRVANKNDFIGYWLSSENSMILRHGPKSRAWKNNLGIPSLKCEAIIYGDAGEYSVVEVRGNLDCPTKKTMQERFSSSKIVQSWSLLNNNRIRISRSDVQNYFEEWEFFTVVTPFEFYSDKFEVGDLVAYLRRHPGNEINAVSEFKHLKPLK